MKRQILSISLLGAALIGCSGNPPKQAEGGFDYIGHKEGSLLKIPADLDQPKYSDKFTITNDINQNGQIGSELDIRSPALVLPIASSSRIDLQASTTSVWFDKVFEDKSLQAYIHQALIEKLKSENVTLTTVDAEKDIYESSWFLKEHMKDYVLYNSLQSMESMRFKYSYEIKSHRRSLALHVELIDYMQTNEAGGSDKLTALDKKRAEVNMLNEVISQVDYDYRVQRQKMRLAKASQEIVTVGTNNEGEPAYIVEMDFDILWDSLPLFFSDYGFKILDLDENKFIYHVQFTKPEVSFWDVIWGNDVETLDVKDAKYQFHLTRYGKHSAVTIHNENGDILPAATLERIFPVMQKGLSFRNLF